MVFDSSLETGTTVKTCLLLPKHRKFIICDSDSDNVSKMRSFLLRVFAKQILTSILDNYDSNRVRAAAKLYFKRSSLEVEAHQKSFWKALPGVPPV